jgi:hypothetical protein
VCISKPSGVRAGDGASDEAQRVGFGLRFAFQPRSAAGALLGCYVLEIFYLVRYFLAAADFPF